MRNGSDYARQAGNRLLWHGAACVACYLVVAALTVALALWSNAEGMTLMLIGGVGCAAASGYAYYLVRGYRVRCPECEFEGAHFARDTLNRQLLVCSQCGLRMPTGRKVLADSPVGH